MAGRGAAGVVIRLVTRSKEYLNTIYLATKLRDALGGYGQPASRASRASRAGARLTVGGRRRPPSPRTGPARPGPRHAALTPTSDPDREAFNWLHYERGRAAPLAQQATCMLSELQAGAGRCWQLQAGAGRCWQLLAPRTCPVQCDLSLGLIGQLPAPSSQLRPYRRPAGQLGRHLAVSLRLFFITSCIIQFT